MLSIVIRALKGKFEEFYILQTVKRAEGGMKLGGEFTEMLAQSSLSQFIQKNGEAHVVECRSPQKNIPIKHRTSQHRTIALTQNTKKQ